MAPHGIQIDDAGTIYVTCDMSRKLLVIDPKARSIEAAIDTEGTGHWAAVLPDASKAYVANKNDKLYISVIDLKKRRIVARIPAPNGTEGIAASPDGKYVVAVDHAEPKLLVIDPATDTVEVTIPLEGNTKASFKPRFSPDGSKLLVCNMSERLVNIIDVADPHGKQQVMTVGKDPMGFAFAPDGKTVAGGQPWRRHRIGDRSVAEARGIQLQGRRRRGIAGLLLGATFWPARLRHKRPAQSSPRPTPRAGGCAALRCASFSSPAVPRNTRPSDPRKC